MTLIIKTFEDENFDLETIKNLFREYNEFIGIDLNFQDFEKELETLPGKYHPAQRGQLYLALWDESIAGCTAIYQLEEGICELKRLYVKLQFQGLRIGKSLIERAITDARCFGFEKMYLDSLCRLKSARTLYEKMGFYEIKPYNHNPYPDVYYMALNLQVNM